MTDNYRRYSFPELIGAMDEYMKKELYNPDIHDEILYFEEVPAALWSEICRRIEGE